MIWNCIWRQICTFSRERMSLQKSKLVAMSLALLTSIPILIVSCIPALPGKVTPTRFIVENNLPVDLRWSAQASLADSGTPMVCYKDIGAIAGIMKQGDKQIEGAILFDGTGQTLQVQSGGGPVDVALNNQNMFVFKYFSPHPTIHAFNIESGEKEWQTSEEVDYRQGISYLTLKGNNLIYLTSEQINIYAIEDGSTISSEYIPTENLVLRQGGIDLYDGNGYYLYATVAGEPENYLWSTEYHITGMPAVYEGNIIALLNRRQRVCSLRLSDGQVNWCSDKQLNSNIAVHDGLGYAVNVENQLVAFQLSDGVDTGALNFYPQNEAPAGFVTACEGSLLVYLRSPDQIFWFDFTSEP